MTEAASLAASLQAPAIHSTCPVVSQFEISAASAAFTFRRMILYIRSMTRLLQQAVEAVSGLPDEAAGRSRANSAAARRRGPAAL
jgi:hypothetical protein